MRKIIAGILCTLLAASCLCGCEKKDSDTGGGKERLYLLSRYEHLNGDGQVLSRKTYTYDERGLVIACDRDEPGENPVFSEEDGLYVVEWLPCDGVADIRASYSYDEYGNPTLVNDGYGSEIRYEYQYDEAGRIVAYTEITEDGEQTTVELEYADGTIKQWKADQSRDEEPIRIIEMTGASKDRIRSILDRTMEHERKYLFEYDQAGNLTDFYYTWLSGTLEREASCTYDNAGRLTEDSGLRGDPLTFEYEENMLTAINGEVLERSTGSNGELILRYKNYELTYMPMELSEADADLARYRWNQFGADFSVEHNYTMGMLGARYPVFELDTVLLLP